MNTGTNNGQPLQGRTLTLDSAEPSTEYARCLLRSLGAEVVSSTDQPADVNTAIAIAKDWASSGLIPLTGTPAQPMQGPAAIPSAARGALDALKQLAGQGRLADLDGARLLTERAAFMQLSRQGQVSANGSCQLLKAKDGWIALNLARDDDWQLLAAWLENPLPSISWQAVSGLVATKPLTLLLERGRLLGLPVASVRSPGQPGSNWFSVSGAAPAATANKHARPLVVDLSSLWAGPLCSHLLLQAGARVIKVESDNRLDGARSGNSDFFDLLNAGKQSAVFRLSTERGRRQLKALLAEADIVIEGSRPRALQQLGIDAEQLVNSVPGLTWVSITGYGRSLPEANWVAFGDDAAIAAGAAADMASAGGQLPLFCGDALADPLAGIHAAVAALAYWQGGGGLVDLSLCNVTGYCLDFYPQVDRGQVVAVEGGWQLIIDNCRFAVDVPTLRSADNAAVAAGCDTRRILEEFNLPC